MCLSCVAESEVNERLLRNVKKEVNHFISSESKEKKLLDKAVKNCS